LELMKPNEMMQEGNVMQMFGQVGGHKLTVQDDDINSINKSSNDKDSQNKQLFNVFGTSKARKNNDLTKQKLSSHNKDLLNSEKAVSELSSVTGASLLSSSGSKLSSCSSVNLNVDSTADALGSTNSISKSSRKESDTNTSLLKQRPRSASRSRNIDAANSNSSYDSSDDYVDADVNKKTSVFGLKA